MKVFSFVLAVYIGGVFVQSGCAPAGSIIDEEDDPAFVRGKSYLKVGREAEALDEFLSVTRRGYSVPQLPS